MLHYNKPDFDMLARECDEFSDYYIMYFGYNSFVKTLFSYYDGRALPDFEVFDFVFDILQSIRSWGHLPDSDAESFEFVLHWFRLFLCKEHNREAIRNILETWIFIANRVGCYEIQVMLMEFKDEFNLFGSVDLTL